MATSGWRAAAGGATVVLSAAIGAVTNMVTGRWSTTLFVVLVALVVLGVVLQVAVTLTDTADAPGGPVLRARASGRSRILQAGRDIDLHGDSGRSGDQPPS
jgi:hypothetical protein